VHKIVFLLLFNYYLPVEKCAFSKDIFPGLSRSWNFKEKKIQDFPGSVGTLISAHQFFTSSLHYLYSLSRLGHWTFLIIILCTLVCFNTSIRQVLESIQCVTVWTEGRLVYVFIQQLCNKTAIK